MNIKQTYQLLKTVVNNVLPDYTFHGMQKSRYNSTKQIDDYVLIVEPPRQWPLNARITCTARFNCKVWLLIRQSIKPVTGGMEQYPPFSEIDIRDTLIRDAILFVNGINATTNLRVVSNLNQIEPLVTLTDAVEGTTTNIQASAYFTIDIETYGENVSIPPVVISATCTENEVTVTFSKAMQTNDSLSYYAIWDKNYLINISVINFISETQLQLTFTSADIAVGNPVQMAITPGLLAVDGSGYQGGVYQVTNLVV